MAKGAATDHPYVQSLEVNGKPASKTYLPRKLRFQGGALDFDLSDKPNTTWGIGKGDEPPSFGTP